MREIAQSVDQHHQATLYCIKNILIKSMHLILMNYSTTFIRTIYRVFHLNKFPEESLLKHKFE